MLWKRLVIHGVPLALLILFVEAFRSMDRNRPARPADGIVLAVTELPDHLNPFRQGNAASETIKTCLFDHLLERNEAFELEPRLAVSWKLSMTVRFFFVSARHAQDALVTITAAQDDWEKWGVVNLRADNDEVRVGFKEPGGDGPKEIFALLDEKSVLPVRVLRAKVLQSAWDSYLDFKRNALESVQIRGEWRKSNSSFELAVAGDTGNFLREFKSYYDTNTNLGASYRFEEEDLPYLEGSELLLSLRKGVVWHDGEPFTSEDVLFSYDLSGEQPWNSVAREILEPVEAVTAVDAHTVRIVYREVEPMPLEKWATIPILPKHLLEGKSGEWRAEAFDESPAGTGPMRLASWVPGGEATSGANVAGRLVLERNEDYFLGSPETARLSFVAIPDAAERRLRFLAGEIDSYLLDEGGGSTALLEKRFDVLSATMERQVVLVWNPAGAPAGGSELRRALRHAIDAGELIAEACPGEGEPPAGLFHPASRFAGAAAALPASGGATVRERLAEAGWVRDGGDGLLENSGESLEIRLAIEEGDAALAAAARCLKRTWEALGAAVEVVALPAKQISFDDPAFPAPEADALLLRMPLAMDWLSFRHGTAGRIAEMIAAEFENGEGRLAEALEELNETADPEERIALCREVERLLLEAEALTGLFLERRYRVVRPGAIALSRAIGDGHRVEKELEAAPAGTDFHLPWWVRSEGW